MSNSSTNSTPDNEVGCPNSYKPICQCDTIKSNLSPEEYRQTINSILVANRHVIINRPEMTRTVLNQGKLDVRKNMDWSNTYRANFERL